MSNVCHQCVKTSIDEPVCYWCRNCEETVCECCKETHFQGHQFEKNGSPLILMKMSIFCGNHHDTELKYFCKDHCSVFCGDCRLVDHRGCRNVLSIVDASKGFKLQEVFNDYKNFLKTILKSFGNLIKILKRWKHDVKIQAYNHQTETESNFLRVVEIGQQKIVKEQYLKEVKDDMDTCLLELQKQISIVAKCKTDIITIETSFKRIWEQLPEDKLFLMVCLSITFLQSTWKKAISDSEGINLDFPGMEVGGKNETFGTREQKLQQMLLVSLVKQELADFGTQNKIISFPQFD